MKYNILISCALSHELKIIKETIKKINIFNLDISYLITWVGNYNTIYNLKNHINKNWKPDFVLNFWVVWKASNSSDDFFQVYRIINASNKKESIVPIYFKALNLESILSSENVITNEKYLQWEDYVDMESFWINYVASKESLPVILIKKPFDIVWSKSNNVSIEELKNSLKSFDYERILTQIRKYLENNKKDLIDLDYYKTYFKFTFSEFEIFKKNYNKMIAYKVDFDSFFEENRELAKKEFLEKLKEI